MVGVRARCRLVLRGRRLVSYSSRVLDGRLAYVQSSCVGGPAEQAGLSPRILLYFRISTSPNCTLEDLRVSIWFVGSDCEDESFELCFIVVTSVG